ncbi:MAG: L-threonine 3-dehydrogenase [Chloroflexota bacterium]
MRGEMRALVKTQPAPGATLVTSEIPSVGPRDVLVKVKAASVCGTDLHIFDWDAWAQSRIKIPRRFGHEFAGEVVEVGSQVSTVRPGDFVSADSHKACGVCHQCRTGRSHVCANLSILGVDVDGIFADYAAIPESSIWKNDPSLPPDVACVQDALGNAVYATLAEPVAGKSVAVFGCGPAGLFSVGVARASGAWPVFLIGKHEYRLAIGRQMGATETLLATDDVVGRVLGATGGDGVEVVLEMTGSPLAVEQGFQVLTKGGRFSAFGIPHEPMTIDLANQIIFKGARVLGINGRLMFETWNQMASLLGSGALDPRPIITHRFPLDQYEEAFALMRSRERRCGKVVLLP